VKTVKDSEVRKLLREKGHDAWVEMTVRYGKTFRVSGVVATCEPEAVRTLLMEKIHTEVRSKIYDVMRKIPGANGILFVDGESWLKRIKAVMPAFHREHVDTFPASLSELTLRHAKRWQEQGRVEDLASAIQQLGAESVLKMGYGLDPDHARAKELGQALVAYKQTTMNPDPRYRLDEFGMGTNKIWQLPWLLHSTFRTWRRTVAVRAAVAALSADAQARKNKPGWFADLSQSDLSETDFANEINHLYGAFNAIDYVTTTALYELGRDPKLLSNIRKELNSVLGDKELATREDLPQLPLMRGFILEILRIYPVAMGVARQTGAAIKLGGEELPAGTEVMILLHAVHHHPDYWDEPKRLLPSRWADSDAPRVPYSYAPFLDGLRKCIGRSMAEMQLLTILTTIVRNYDVGVFADGVIPPFMIPRFSKPLPFVLQKPLPS
jgi:cytochrome P450